MKKEYILVIDSGAGGLSTLCEVYKRISANFIYFADNKNCPYGSHKKKEIFGFLKNIIDEVLKKYYVSLVVLACNTATTSSISKLRNAYPNLVFVGTEPAIKFASSLGYKKILMISTPVTAEQKKYIELKSSLDCEIVSLKMQGFANHIELWLAETAMSDANLLGKLLKNNSENLGENLAKNPCGVPTAYTDLAHSSSDEAPCQQCFFHADFYRELGFGLLQRMKMLQDLMRIRQKSGNFDCIVLGCTHYSLVSGIVRDFSHKPLISGNFGVAKEILRHFPCQNSTESKSDVKFMFSNPSKQINQIYKKIFMQILANS